MTPQAELAEYLGRPLEAVTERCKYAFLELAWKWPEYKDDPIKFYQESDLYLFDLANYHDILEQRGTHKWFRDKVKEMGFKTMLDFGGGNGDWTIQAYEGGAECDYLDLEGEMSKYAEWRFGKRDLKVNRVSDTGLPRAKRYDAIIVLDVLEHLSDPKPLVEHLGKMVEYIFCNPIEEIPYTWVYPQHISRYDLTPYFEQVDKYLWKSRSFPAS
jgi:hypothetical protein